MRKNTVPMGLALVIILILAAFPAQAFNVETRKDILEDAIAFCPPNLKAYLIANMDVVEKGMFFSDLSQTPPSPQNAPGIHKELASRLQNRSAEYNTVNLFGVLACHIAETIYPGHQNTTASIAPAKVRFDGVNFINDPKEKIGGLLKACKPYYTEKDRAVTQSLYLLAVNEVVDFWVSAWRDAGLTSGEPIPPGKEIERNTPMMIQVSPRSAVTR